jgi:hypothetical protein
VGPAIFITFSSKDQKVAQTICTALENRGLACWMSSRDVKAGQNYQEQIVKAIRAAKTMVLVFTANANNSNEIKKELALASQNNLVVIPVRIEDVTPNEAFAYEFATRQWIDLFDDWENSITRLVGLIAAAIDDAPSGDRAKAASGSTGEAGAAPFMQRPGPRWAMISGVAVLVVAAIGYWVSVRPLVVGSQQPAQPMAQATSPTATEAAKSSEAVSVPAKTNAVASRNHAFIGSGTNASVNFGGPPYCMYNVSMQDLALTSLVSEDGKVILANLTGKMVETTVGNCAFLPIGTNPHSYSGTGSVNGTNISLQMDPAPTNSPHALATFDGQIVGERLVGTLTIHRNDIGGNLAWTVRSIVK